jgi:hypothetical protein
VQMFHHLHRQIARPRFGARFGIDFNVHYWWPVRHGLSSGRLFATPDDAGTGAFFPGGNALGPAE